MVNDYKAAKEAFVSNLTGGTVWEINTVTLVAPSAVLLWSVLQSRQSFFSPYTPAACLTDVLLNCIAILLATTVYSYSPLLLNGLLISHAVFAAFASAPANTHAAHHPRAHPAATSEAATKDPLPQKPFVTAWRGAMMVITCVAILAVDFRVFPRRFAKVENWGTSLMDMGVGAFVFSAGTVSARSLLRQQINRNQLPLGPRLWGSFKHSLPLLVLGLIRLYSVKGLDYAEHVTEYGVHWNFFFTLGLLPPFVALFESAFSLVPSFAALSVLLAVAYELTLNLTNLKAFILTAPRTDLLSQNREGIFSFLGYLAIFLAGRATGMSILPRDATPPTPRGSRRPTPLPTLLRAALAELHATLPQTRGNLLALRSAPLPQTRLLAQRLRVSPLARLLAHAAAWSALYIFSTAYIGLNLRVSRRLANLPYVLWVAAFNTAQLALFRAIQSVFFPGVEEEAGQRRGAAAAATPRVLHAFNRNGLAIFLLANLLTGVVNLGLRTLEMGTVGAMAVLVAYVGVLAGVALGLDAWGVSVKV